ncbi:MAG: hypothetical protein BWY10_02381 [Chloroflexi bacterium ADurb.Bin180]|nr:MAG: hypothetical protein BWY10_02381 [Chloroflexi bacterium ADurb.Bin180]
MGKERSIGAAERVLLLVILLVAAWLRLGWPRIVSFGYDEARVSRLALEMAHLGHFAAVGMPTSAGVPNFPAAVWLYALPYALSTDPLIAVAFTALANVLAVAGVWWLARQAWGRWAAVAAATLGATSPYLVFYSRGIWGQDWLVPGAVLWAVCLVKGLREQRDRWLGGAAFLAGCVGQVHPAGFSLAVATAWLVIRLRLWRYWRGLCAGTGLAALAAAPMAVQVLKSPTEAEGLRQMLGQRATASLTSVRQLARLAASKGWEWFWLGPDWQWGEPLRTVLGWLPLLLGATVAVGMLWLVHDWSTARGAGRSGEGEGARALLTILVPWVVTAPALFLWSKTPPYIQYQLTAVPAVYLAAGAAFRGRRRPAGRVVLAAMVLLAAVVQVRAVSRTLDVVQERQVAGGLGTPLLYAQTAVNELREKGQPVVVETAGADPAFDGDAAVFDVLLWGSERRLVDGRVALLVPEKGANLLFNFDTLPAWEVASDLGIGVPGTLPRRQGEPPYATLQASVPLVPTLTSIEPVRLANGAALSGWTVQTRTGGGTRLITAWRIDRRAAAQYHQFNHLYVEGRPGPAAVHDFSAQSAAWQAGDLLITWADFESVADKVLRWEVGMYSYPGIVRVPLEAGGDAIVLQAQP